jgi:hypothetical protein
MPAGTPPRHLRHRCARTAECHARRPGEAGQDITAARPWLVAQVATINLQHIEGIQEGRWRALTAKACAHAIEFGLAVDATDDAFAVEHYRARRQGSVPIFFLTAMVISAQVFSEAGPSAWTAVTTFLATMRRAFLVTGDLPSGLFRCADR